MKRPGMTNFLQTAIYGITADEYSLGRGNVETVRLLIAAGIRVIQYREKRKSARQMYEECMAIRSMTREAGATFIVNDHIDLAILAAADGVHIGQDDLPPEKVRDLIGNDMVLGLSTHSIIQARSAEALGGIIDYIGVGPIFATQTKQDVCDPVGFEYLDYVVKDISLPFVAIGGIKEHNIVSVREHGARMAALVSELVGAVDVAGKARSLKQLMVKA
ncbi:MAG: thiE [Firmicutes bacterium]|nr:thiE [Bacillota bacterium]